MPTTIIVLFVLALSPLRFTQWTNWFAAQTNVIIMPVAHPISIALEMIIPQSSYQPQASDRERAITSELDRVRTELLRTREENHRLTDRIDQYSRGAEITPDLDVRQIHRPRMSSLIGDHLLIRTGKIDGLTQGAVVVVDAVQLLGKVSRVDGRTSTILPITARSAGPILATVLLNDSGSQQVRCLLKPLGNGTLRGEVARAGVGDTWQVKIGQEVRLLDYQWPQHAQMLVVGTVERIERNESQPLRQRIIVRPTVPDLRMVPEVILRLPAPETDEDLTQGDGEVSP